jgi:hypothetical protein
MNFNRFKLVAVFAMVLAVIGATSASAVNLQLSLDYVGSFTDEFASVPASYSLADGVGVSGVVATDVHQFDIYYALSNLTTNPTPTGGSVADGQVAENSLQQLILDVVLGTGLTQSTSMTYTPYMYPDDADGRYDPLPTGSGGGAARSLYTDNSDGTGNLERIMATTDALAAFGLDPGEATHDGGGSGPTGAKKMGSFYVNWDPSVASSTSLSLIPSASAPVDPWLLYTNGWIDTTNPYTHNAGTAYAPPASAMSGSVNSGGATNGFDLLASTEGTAPVVDDAVYDMRPSSSDYTGIPSMDFEHQFTTSAGDEPITWSNLQVETSPGGLIHEATVSPTGLFSWNRRGAAWGQYVWQVTATNGVGSDTGTLSFFVPEPSSMALCGLAMVGLFGFVRRR